MPRRWCFAQGQTGHSDDDVDDQAACACGGVAIVEAGGFLKNMCFF